MIDKVLKQIARDVASPNMQKMVTSKVKYYGTVVGPKIAVWGAPAVILGM